MLETQNFAPNAFRPIRFSRVLQNYSPYYDGSFFKRLKHRDEVDGFLWWMLLGGLKHRGEKIGSNKEVTPGIPPHTFSGKG